MKQKCCASEALYFMRDKLVHFIISFAVLWIDLFIKIRSKPRKEVVTIYMVMFCFPFFEFSDKLAD